MKIGEKPILFTASPKGRLFEARCTGCEATIIAGTIDKFCPFCFEELSLGALVKKESLRASSSTPRLLCRVCGSKIYSDSPLADEELANQTYCTVCGSSEVEVEKEGEGGEEEDRGKEGKEGIEAVETGETDEGEEETLETEEEAVKESLSSGFLGIEASLVPTPEPTWFFFKGGIPLFKLSRSKTLVDARPIFETDSFVDAFKQRVKDTSLTAAIKEFSGEVFNIDKVLTPLDLESLAFEKLQSQVLPKFQDCLALAVEGAVKGVYPNLNKEIKAAFFDELVARGLTQTKAISAVEAAFIAAGTDMFTALIAKATELLYKKEDMYTEIKATIQSSGTVHKGLIVSEDEIDQKEIREKLVAGNLHVQIPDSLVDLSTTNPIADKTVQTLRDRISFQ